MNPNGDDPFSDAERDVTVALAFEHFARPRSRSRSHSAKAPVRLAAERAAAALTASIGASIEPPVDVCALATSMGISDIVKRPMIGDGQLVRSRDRVCIYVQLAASESRQRFTIAHELGHLWLAMNEPDARWLWGHKDEERFCDVFAAAILMPAEWSRRQAASHPESLAALREISTAANVSLAACLISLRQHGSWSRSLLGWRWEEDAWRLSFAAGVPTKLRNAINTVDKTRQALGVVSRAESQTASGSLTIGVDGHERAVPADLAISGSTALALVSLKEQYPRKS